MSGADGNGERVRRATTSYHHLQSLQPSLDNGKQSSFKLQKTLIVQNGSNVYSVNEFYKFFEPELFILQDKNAAFQEQVAIILLATENSRNRKITTFYRQL